MLETIISRFQPLIFGGVIWVWPPPRMPVANKGLVRNPLLKMVHNPGGDRYYEGATHNV